MDEKGKGALALVLGGRVTVGVWDFEYVPVVGNASLPSIAGANGGTLVSVYASGVFHGEPELCMLFLISARGWCRIILEDFHGS